MTTIKRDFDHNGDYSFDILPCDVLTDDISTLGPRHGFGGVALGFFDGLHIGHRELIRILIYECAALGYEPAVFTMDRYPKPHRNKEGELIFRGLIQSNKDKLNVLHELGVERTYIQSFNKSFAALSPEVFLNDILYDKLKARLIVVGKDFRFGAKAKGDVALIQNWAKERDVKVMVVDDITSDGQNVSSTLIREAIANGDFERVSLLLGCDFTISGTVIKGNALGRTVGLPTANVDIAEDQLMPPFGVYVTRTRVGNRVYESVSNIGLRPTVDVHTKKPLLETVILDYEIDLYGHDIEVSFLHFLRPERKFHSFLALTAQMHQDIQNGRQWLEAHEHLWQISRLDGIGTWIMPTNRFYSNVMHISIASPADPRLSAAHALLSRVITACSAAHPTRAGMARALDELYGASFNADFHREGNWQSILFSASAVSRGTDGSKPFDELVDIVFGAIIHPFLDDDNWLDAAIVEQERGNLLLELEARKDDRARFAFDRCLEETCLQQLHGIPAFGDIDVIRTITREELTEVWRDWLKDSEINVYAAGRLDKELRERLINGWKDAPVNNNRPSHIPGREPMPFVPGPTRVVYETAPIEQTRVALMFKGLPPYPSYQAGVVSVLNSMLGGDAHSLLFDVVREKMGLAYSIMSSPQWYLSCLYVSAGVYPGSARTAVEAVHDQIARIARGDYDIQLFNSSVQLIRNHLLTIADNMESVLSFRRWHLASGRNLSITRALHYLAEVTPEQVNALAGQLEPLTTYMLLPKVEPGQGAKGDQTAKNEASGSATKARILVKGPGQEAEVQA